MTTTKDGTLTETESWRESPIVPHRPSFSPQYDHLPHRSHCHAYGEPCGETGCYLMVPMGNGVWAPEP
jgi:hypothetical protein